MYVFIAYFSLVYVVFVVHYLNNRLKLCHHSLIFSWYCWGNNKFFERNSTTKNIIRLLWHCTIRICRSIPMVGKLRLSDVNFVALVLNRDITQKIKITLYKYVISCSKLFSFIDV